MNGTRPRTNRKSSGLADNRDPLLLLFMAFYLISLFIVVISSANTSVSPS